MVNRSQSSRNRLLEEEQMIRDFAWERPGYMREELKVFDRNYFKNIRINFP